MRYRHVPGRLGEKMACPQGSKGNQGTTCTIMCLSSKLLGQPHAQIGHFKKEGKEEWREGETEGGRGGEGEGGKKESSVKEHN